MLETSELAVKLLELRSSRNECTQQDVDLAELSVDLLHKFSQGEPSAFISCGSQELSEVYGALPNYPSRYFVRYLNKDVPLQESLLGLLCALLLVKPAGDSPDAIVDMIIRLGTY